MAFSHLIHCDWSTHLKKCWQARASRNNDRWEVEASSRVDSPTSLMDDVLKLRDHQNQVLVGFDFPIGVPIAFGSKTGFKNFPAALTQFGCSNWKDFFNVAKDIADISLQRPFYPLSPATGTTRQSLVNGLGVSAFEDLLRQCERKMPGLNVACSLFWTLGGNQVGRAAIAGWQSMVRPLVEHGAKLWPFDGTLAKLEEAAVSIVIAETYPAAAYGHVGISFAGQSKKNQLDRQSKAAELLAWSDQHNVKFSCDAQAMVKHGFGSSAQGEDAFDAFLGLLGMIEVVDQRRADAPAGTASVRQWEGWILGRA